MNVFLPLIRTRQTKRFYLCKVNFYKNLIRHMVLLPKAIKKPQILQPSLFKRFTNTKILILNTSKQALTLANAEREQLARTTLAYCQFVTKPSVITNLITNTWENNNADLGNYLRDPFAGTVQMRVGLLASLGQQKIPVKAALTFYNNSSIVPYHESISLTTNQLAELHIAHHFSQRNKESILKLELTDDTVRFSHLKKNPFQDFKATLQHKPLDIVSERSFDAKSGNFAKGEYFKGEIREVSFYQNEQINYPNKGIDLSKDHYLELSQRLKSESFLQNAQKAMAPQEFLYFKEQADKPFKFLQEQKPYNDIETILMDIQALPSFMKAFNFVNTHHIQDKMLTDNELRFLNRIINQVEPSILNNPRSLTIFLNKALKVYQLQIDPRASQKLKHLRLKYDWIATDLDNITSDIFS